MSGNRTQTFASGWLDSGEIVVNDDGDIVLFSHATESTTSLVTSPDVKTNATVSSDGRFLAYESNESDIREIYVRIFTGGGAAIPVSIGGGYQPRWAPDSSAIYYTNEQKMMRVTVDAQDTLVLGRPETLFELPFQTSGSRTYDVHPDGERFLMMIANNQSGRGSQIAVVRNFFGELKRLDPNRGTN